MLICKILLWKFTHGVTSIITVDCHNNYSHQSSNIAVSAISRAPRAKWEVLKNAFFVFEHLPLCTWSSRDCIYSNFCHTTHLLNVSLKENLTGKTSIIIQRMTTEERARAFGIPRQGSSIQVSPPPPRTPIPASDFGRRHLIGASADRQRKRHVLLL